MPCDYADDSHVKFERYKRAVAQVKAKFPNLIEGSSGWHRALANRLRRTS